MIIQNNKQLKNYDKSSINRWKYYTYKKILISSSDIIDDLLINEFWPNRNNWSKYYNFLLTQYINRSFFNIFYEGQPNRSTR